MHADSLVRMANDIGAFFASEPDKHEAARLVMLHIKRYWDPRMRTQIVAHYDAGAEGLEGHVREAIEMLARERSGSPTKNPATTAEPAQPDRTHATRTQTGSGRTE
jgi:formate dehydrogenase subunit delta